MYFQKVVRNCVSLWSVWRPLLTTWSLHSSKHLLHGCREGGEESPGKSAFWSNGPQTCRSSSLCLGDSRLGDRQVELMLNKILGLICLSIKIITNWQQNYCCRRYTAEFLCFACKWLGTHEKISKTKWEKPLLQAEGISCPSVMILFSCLVHLRHCRVCTEDTCPIGIRVMVSVFYVNQQASGK